MSQTKWAIGIDGGGTQTRIAIGNDTSGLTAQTTVGSSNPSALGIDRCTTQLAGGIDEVLSSATAHRSDVFQAVIALAGVANPVLRNEVAQWAGEHLPNAAVRVLTDIELILAAGRHSKRATIALISGTGSSAVGRAENGAIVKSGGWGYLLGDEGSGFQLGQLALKAILSSAEESGPSTMLTNLIVGNNKDVHANVLQIYTTPNARQAIASYAPVVVQAADDGDTVATQIVGQAANALTQMVMNVAKRLPAKKGEFDLACTGGLWCGAKRLSDQTLNLLDANAVRPASVITVASPVELALEIACER